MPLYDDEPVAELDTFDDVLGSPELPLLPEP